MHAIARQSAEALLGDTVQFIAPKTTGTLNRSTLQITTGDDIILWEGPALFVTAAASRTTDAAGGDTQEDEVKLRTPMGAPDVRPGTIARCVRAQDHELVGEDFQVIRSATRSSSILRSYTLQRYTPHASISSA